MRILAGFKMIKVYVSIKWKICIMFKRILNYIFIYLLSSSD